MIAISRDRRSGIHKAERVIISLRELGYKDGDLIPYDDIEYQIKVNIGIDSRTVRKYLDQMEKLNYLKPKGKPLISRRFTHMRTKFDVVTREYSSQKGYSHYVFGSRAPRIYNETLKLNSLPPHPPQENFCEENSLPNTPKNMCVSQSIVDNNDPDQGLKYLSYLEKGREERRELCSTHIYSPNTLPNTKKEEKKPLSEKSENLESKPLPNTQTSPYLTSTHSLPNTCPKCGKPGSPQLKWVLNKSGKRYRYWYFAHYKGNGKISWCYVGSKISRKLKHSNFETLNKPQHGSHFKQN